MTRIGDWMETFTGRRFYPLDPRADEVFIEDIAHALSLLCRFGGHCREFYSVAQHSCLVADVVASVNSDMEFDALMHDAAEAYTGDIIRPIKRSNPEIGRAEHAVEAVIMAKFGLRAPMPAVVKWADNVMLSNEHAQLMYERNEWPSCDQADGPEVWIELWSPGKAETEFLFKFNKLQAQRGAISTSK